MQANTKWFEGAANQSIYWSITDDGGLTWGPTRVLLPSPDTLPIWGPVQHAAVSTSTCHPFYFYSLLWDITHANQKIQYSDGIRGSVQNELEVSSSMVLEQGQQQLLLRRLSTAQMGTRGLMEGSHAERHPAPVVLQVPLSMLLGQWRRGGLGAGRGPAL